MRIFNGKLSSKFSIAVPVAILVCLAPLLVAAPGIKARNRIAGGAYITLITDEGLDDKLIAEKLGGAGVKNVLSESSQWFFLNDFSGLRRMPLDEFSDSLLETDPRNDGYARRLSSLFVRDGLRYFYIPESSIRPASPEAAGRRISGALDGIPYSLEIPDTYRADSTNGALIFIVAALLSLLLSALVPQPAPAYAGGGRRMPEFTLMVAALLPASSLFARQGPAGLALTALSLALFIMLYEPLKFLFMRRSPDAGFSTSRIAYVKRFLSRERDRIIFMFVLFTTVFIAGGINIIYAPAVFLLCCLSAAAYFWAVTVPRGRNPHPRFVPVDIRPRRRVKRRVMLVVLPFTLASVVSACIPFVTGSGRQMPRHLPPSAINRDIPAIDSGDYERHLAFQKTFSFRKLGAGDQNSEYIRFETGSDGLLYPASGDPSGETGFEAGDSGIPPFPLEKLIAFLKGEGYTALTRNFDVKTVIAVLLALLLYIPNSGFPVYGNWKKERNTLYISESVTL
ncbi:MAG: hypothetical protein LBD86_00385 [Spirochaetaceae bacterium]|jgi:hypothetical protein|nr:hypothetical protein [Spirochaetaceae bacterium]